MRNHNTLEETLRRRRNTKMAIEIIGVILVASGIGVWLGLHAGLIAAGILILIFIL